MTLIGLTGGYCAGKNTVAEMLERRGWASIDVDRLGHRALEIARDEVVERFDAEARERFGRGLVDADGRLDRKLLGAIVFSDPRKLAEHEAIIHPVMFDLVDERVAELREKARPTGGADAGGESRIVINAAILYKMPIVAECSATIEVRAPLLLRLKRARVRDGLGPLRALDRIRRQAPLWRLRPKGPSAMVAADGGGRSLLGAPVSLRNAGDAADLEKRLERLLASIEAGAEGNGRPTARKH